MGSRNSYEYWAGGRGSPYLSNLAEASPRNLSGHFEYIGDDHDLFTNSHHRPSVAVNEYPDLDDTDPAAPDRIHVRFMASVFPVDFPPYSVNEARASVEDLRRRVADRLGVDPRRVRLIYKGRDLKRNQYPLKHYKMKQNSEVSAVVTDRLVDYYTADSRDDESGSDSNSSNTLSANPRRQRPRSHSSIRLRSDDKIPMVNTSSTHLHPNGHVSSTPVERQSRNSLHPSDRPDRSDRDRGRERAPSQSRGVSPARNRAPSPARTRGVSPAPPPTSNIPPADPSTPLGKLQALTSTFHREWLPQSIKFCASPPEDPAVRQKEFLKLSESIMQKIVLQADNIETEGNMDARNVRKNLVNEVHKVLKELDAVPK